MSELGLLSLEGVEDDALNKYEPIEFVPETLPPTKLNEEEQLPPVKERS